MIIETNKTGRLPMGRHAVRREVDFYEENTPSWISIVGTNMSRINGTISGVTSISSFSFNLGSVEAVSQKYFNINFTNDSTANISIKFTKTDGTAYFELANDNTLQKDIFKYHDSNIDLEDDNVDYIQGSRFWGLLSYGTSDIGNKPRNIELVLNPINKFIALIENDSLLYEWDFFDQNITFDGDWRLQISSDVPFDLSGVNYIIEKNI